MLKYCFASWLSSSLLLVIGTFETKRFPVLRCRWRLHNTISNMANQMTSLRRACDQLMWFDHFGNLVIFGGLQISRVDSMAFYWSEMSWWCNDDDDNFLTRVFALHSIALDGPSVVGISLTIHWWPAEKRRYTTSKAKLDLIGHSLDDKVATTKWWIQWTQPLVVSEWRAWRHFALVVWCEYFSMSRPLIRHSDLVRLPCWPRIK